jgi:hypothetical protein
LHQRLTAEAGFPVTVATANSNPVGSSRDPVSCPVPGIDRCNDGNTLSSPTVATDPTDPNHLFVTFSEFVTANAEEIVAVESTTAAPLSNSLASWL